MSILQRLAARLNPPRIVFSRSKRAARKLVSTDMTPKLIEELSSQGRYVPAFFKEGRNG